MAETERIRERAQRLLAFAVPALVFTAVLALYGIRYHTNDDATMANIAAGAYGPDRVHLVYVNILFGWLLRPLYALAEGFNWYVAASLLASGLACAALCWLAMRRLGTAGGVCLFLAVALPFSVGMVYLFEFTKNGGICVAAGLAWLAVYLGRGPRQVWPGIALALLGSLIRWEMFCAVGGLSAAVLLARFFVLDKAGKCRAAATMAVLFALVFGAMAADRAAYRADPGWRAYMEYNDARSSFSDYKAYQLPAEGNALAGQGVSDNDYAMLMRWDFYDGTAFPAERLQALADSIPARGLAQSAQETLRRGWQMLHSAPYGYAFALVVLAGLVLLRPGRAWLPFAGTLALLGGEVFLLVWQDRLPQYVELPLLLAAAVLLLLCIGQGPRRAVPGRRPGLALAAAGLALGLGIALPTLARTRADAAAYREWAVLEQGYFDAMSADKDHLYLLSTESINVGAGLDVWHPRAPGYYSNIVAYGGWLSHAPHREAALAAYGLADPLTDAVDNAAVYLDYHNIEGAACYAAEHLGRPVTAVAAGPNAFAPYQLVGSAGG